MKIDKPLDVSITIDVDTRYTSDYVIEYCGVIYIDGALVWDTGWRSDENDVYYIVNEQSVLLIAREKLHTAFVHLLKDIND